MNNSGKTFTVERTAVETGVALVEAGQPRLRCVLRTCHVPHWCKTNQVGNRIRISNIVFIVSSLKIEIAIFSGRNVRATALDSESFLTNAFLSVDARRIAPVLMKYFH